MTKLTSLRVGDYVVKDGEVVRVDRIEEDTVYTSDGGCMGLQEIQYADILLESEAYDYVHGGKKWKGGK